MSVISWSQDVIVVPFTDTILSPALSPAVAAGELTAVHCLTCAAVALTGVTHLVTTPTVVVLAVLRHAQLSSRTVVRMR